jgi:hypothetical protein
MASVYMFNQTGSSANVIVNNGNQFTINGTSDSSGWVANSKTLTYQFPDIIHGNFNSGQNTLQVNLSNSDNYFYRFTLPANAGSVEVHILAADQSGAVATLVVLVEGLPVTSTTSLIAGTPASQFVP